MFVPVNPRLTPPEQDRLINRTGAVACIRLDRPGHFAIGNPAGAASDTNEPATPAATGHHAADRDGLAVVLTTSGTTGEPKPVALHHRRVIDGIDTVLATLRRRQPAGASSREPRPDRPPNIVPVPLSLWAGIYNVLFALRTGAGVVLLDPFDPARFAAAVREHRVRSSVLAPAMMTMLADDASIESLEPLRIVRSITAPLSPLQARRFRERFGVTVLNSYGQTELGGEVIGWSAADAREFGDSKLGALGRPHAGIEVEILDGDQPVPPGTDGEICVRSPYMMAGYVDAETEQRLTPAGFLRTGDVGHVDEDGFVWLSGRVSDMVNRGGLKVFPGEVEEVLRLHPAVADAAVVGEADKRLGEVPVAFLVAAEPGSPRPDAATLDRHCRASLAPYKVPVRFEWLTELPRNEVGKVLRRALVQTPQDTGT